MFLRAHLSYHSVMDEWTMDMDAMLAHPSMATAARLISTEEIDLADIAEMDIHELWQIWHAAKGTRFAPARRDLPLDDMPPALLPRMAVIDFVGPPLDFFYRFFGTAMVKASGIELTGKTYYADGITGYGFANAALLPKLIERRAPLAHRVTWNSKRGLTWRTTALRIPLSEDGEAVTGAITVNHYDAAQNF